MFAKKSKIIQALIVLALLCVLVMFTISPSVNQAVDDYTTYKDTVYPVSMIMPVLDSIMVNRALLQQYMATRYPKVAELDWENPDEVDPQKALWKFRWLSRDWYLVATFEPYEQRLTSLYSYEAHNNE